MATKRYEATVQLDSGLIIPASAGLGRVLASDDTGAATWSDQRNDALQLGFVSAGSPITATINSSTGVLTFTNAPGANVPAWFPSAAGVPFRGTCPTAMPAAAPTPLPAYTKFKYVCLYYLNPSTPGGAATAALVTANDRTTANLAAADQAQQSGQTALLVWDGIIQNSAGSGASVYALVAGGATGVTGIPATGRDRRAWARGALYAAARGEGANTTSAALTAMDSTHWLYRLECTGVPVRLHLSGIIQATAACAVAFNWMRDGTALASGEVSQIILPAGAAYLPFSLDAIDFPPAGSHYYYPAWLVTAGAQAIIPATAADPVYFTLEEMVRQNAYNGTA